MKNKSFFFFKSIIFWGGNSKSDRQIGICGSYLKKKRKKGKFKITKFVNQKNVYLAKSDFKCAENIISQIFTFNKFNFLNL